MPIYALGDQVPHIHPDAFVHPEAVIIGSVEIGPHSSVWPCAVLRGDGGRIVVGARTSIQDGSVLHTTPTAPTTVKDDCVIGHIVHLEGCTVGPRALVGSGSVVLHRAVVSTGAVVGANSLLLNDTEVPAGALAAGSPAVIKPGKARLHDVEQAAQVYLLKAQRYRAELRRVDR